MPNFELETELKYNDFPQIIRCSYKYDLQIIDIHECIRKKYSYLYRTDETNRKGIMNSWKSYVNDTKDLLCSYESLNNTNPTKSRVFHFGSKPKKSVSDVKIEDKKLEIIDKYVKRANREIELDVTKIPHFEIGCGDCGTSLERMVKEDNTGTYVCKCGGQFGDIEKTDIRHKDPENMDMTRKNITDGSGVFARRLKRYQGIAKPLPEDLYIKIDNYLQKQIGLPPAEEIRKMPVLEYGQRCEETNIQQICLALQALGENKYNSYINFIAYNLWGWIPPDLGDKEEIVLSKYSKINRRWKELHPHDSRVNAEMQLYWLLRASGHDCLPSHFKFPSMSDVRADHSEFFSGICKELDIDFVPLMT